MLELGCYPLLHRVPLLLLPSPTMSADQRVKAVGGGECTPSPAAGGRAALRRGLTRESRRRRRLPSWSGPQSRAAVHSPAGSRWPTRAAGDMVAQKGHHWPPTPGLAAARGMLSGHGNTAVTRTARSPPCGPQESGCAGQGCEDGWFDLGRLSGSGGGE